MRRDTGPSALARAGLALAGTVALLLGAVWWLYAGLLAGSSDSSCADSLSAEVAFAASFGGLGLAIAAIVTPTGNSASPNAAHTTK